MNAIVRNHHGRLASAALQGYMKALVAGLVFWAAAVEAAKDGYWECSTCSGCHAKIFEQHSESMHAKSYSNEAFQAQYLSDVLPRAQKDSSRVGEARGCIACHSPITAQVKSSGLILAEDVDPEKSGVTCDFCHTMTGFRGESSGNANYTVQPGEVKFGPLVYESSMTWHHAYSRFQTQSEACGVCHNQTNAHGLEIKATYTEWKESRYAKEGIHCQNCHMTIHGFLSGGKSVYEAGKATQTSLAKVPSRQRLYTHRFPGAHSKSQIAGALTVKLMVDEHPFAPGDRLEVKIAVDNSRTGHKMPSGSADLRLLWLELNAIDVGSGSRNPISVQMPGFMVNRETVDQRVFAEEDVPPGSRVYRAIFHDDKGKPTLASYEAVKIASDSCLEAGEVRMETFRLKIPESATKGVLLSAELKYLPYPTAFARRLALDDPEVIVVASAKKLVDLKAPLD